MAVSRAQVLEYLGDRFGLDVATLDDDEPLFSTGLLDSFNVTELVTFLEEHTGAVVTADELSFANLDTVARVVAFGQVLSERAVAEEVAARAGEAAAVPNAADSSAVADVSIGDVVVESAEIVARWLSDPAINQWLFGEVRGQIVSARQVMLMASSPRNRLWLVRCGGEPCGLVALSQVDSHDCSARLWYLLGDQRFGGRGVTTRAVKLVLPAAFTELGLRSVNASVMEPNVASMAVLERCGFRFVGRLRAGLRHGEGFVDRLVYDVLPEDVG